MIIIIIKNLSSSGLAQTAMRFSDTNGSPNLGLTTRHSDSHQRIGTGTRGLENKRTSGDYPNYS